MSYNVKSFVLHKYRFLTSGFASLARSYIPRPIKKKLHRKICLLLNIKIS